MTMPLSLLAAATAAVPVDPAAVEAAAPAVEAGLNYLDLVLHASWPVLIVMILLLVASVMSWFVIFRKAGIFQRANREAEEFEGRFWSGAELNALYRTATERHTDMALGFTSHGPCAARLEFRPSKGEEKL